MLRKSNISYERAASNFLYPESGDQVRGKFCYTLTELHGFRYLRVEEGNFQHLLDSLCVY